MDGLISRLKQLSKSSKKIIVALENYEKKKAQPVANIYLLENILGNIEKLCHDLVQSPIKEQLLDWHSHEISAIEKFKEDFRINFGQELATLFNEVNKKIRGQYPLLRVGWYTIKIDFQLGEAIIFYGPEIERIMTKIPLQAKIIYETVKKFDVNLRSVKITPEETLNTLRRAYENRLKTSSKEEGEKLSLIEVLDEFVLLRQSKKFFIDPTKSHFQEYPRVLLSYLLYFFKKSTLFGSDIHLHVATFDATIDKINALWVPENEEGEGTHYSHISFN